MYIEREIDVQSFLNCSKITSVEQSLYCHGITDCNVISPSQEA